MALTQTQVSQLYVSIFGRASEGEGNIYWQTNQPDMVSTANVMLNTDAAKAYFGDTLYDDQAFIEFIYENTLGKTYAEDPDGVDYWVAELASGKSKGEVVTALINAAIAPENAGAAQDQFNNRVEVSNYTANAIFDFSGDYDQFTGYIDGIDDDPASVAAAKAEINDDAPPATYTLANDVTSVIEGNAVTFTVTASHASNDDVTLNYQIAGVEVAGGTADPASDLGEVVGGITLLAGETSVTFSLTATDDGLPEGFEGFVVSLLNDSFETVATSGNVVIRDDPGIGLTYTLTTGLDDVVGTANNDTIKATVGDDADSTTFNSGDYIDGGAGDDTLVITAIGDDMDGAMVEMDNVENVTVRNYSDSTLDLNAAMWSGVDNYGIKGGDDYVNIYNITEAFSTITLQDFGAGETDGDYVDLEVADTVFMGDDDAVTVVLDNFGAGPVKVPARTLDDDVLDGNDESIDGEYGYLSLYNDSDDSVIETFNIVSTGDNDRGNFLKIYDGYDAATTLNISGDTDLFINFNDGGTSDSLTTVDASALEANLFLRGMDTDAEVLTITGAQGDNDIAAGDAESKIITTFDGDDLIMAGYNDVEIDAGNGDNEIHAGNADNAVITTGDGNDVVKAKDLDSATITTGAGDDSVTVTSLFEGDSVDGGDGIDTIAFYGNYAGGAVEAVANEDEDFADRFQNFEIVKLCNISSATVDMAYLNDIQDVVLGYNINNATILGLSDGANLGFMYENTGSIVTVELTETEGDQSFNLDLMSSPVKVNWDEGYEQGPRSRG